jgi:hypothetical protein
MDQVSDGLVAFDGGIQAKLKTSVSCQAYAGQYQK